MDEAKKPFECLERLRADVDSKKRTTTLSFEEFLGVVQQNPSGTLRNIFQLFHDMVQSNIVKKKDEYPDDPESIGYVEYDCSGIFELGMDNPFFPDRLLANRFVKQVEGLRQGSQQNRMHVYLGPPGCGKSTFLNNLLQKFERFVGTEEGQTFEIFWQIEMDSQKIEVPCPSHDHPILIIPKDRRVAVLDRLLCTSDSEEEHSWLFNGEAHAIHESLYKIADKKEYEWLFKGKACTICESIFRLLCDKLGSLDQVLGMVKVRPYRFNRRTGEGISIFNPGDKPPKELNLSDKQIQEGLDKIFGVNQVKYVFSQLARTNNGIYALMDIKLENQGRLLDLHNVISEGVHKVNGVEEEIRSLFFALMNPEDKKVIEEKKADSFEARIQWATISYVMEVATELKIFRSIFGNNIDSYFLPRVMENFARVIISSRMAQECGPFQDWIQDISQYNKRHLCDEAGLLLRMEIYGGIIPAWLSEEHKKKFTAQIRRDLIAEAAKEGNRGFSGRDSIKHFGEFLGLYGPKPGESRSRLISMASVVDYFKYRISREARDDNIPKNFIASLVDWYDYAVFNEVKEALYFYNKEQIREDILHYLCAINYDADGRKIKCQYTGKEIEVTIEFLKLIGSYILGAEMTDYSAARLAQEYQKKYIGVLARNPTKAITETELYQELFNSYVRNLKEKVLHPFAKNDSFREAVKCFGSKEFETFDTRIKEHVTYMIRNLVSKFGYTEQGAKEICLYVLDQDLVKKFS